jgi:hypothetical protein
MYRAIAQLFHAPHFLSPAAGIGNLRKSKPVMLVAGVIWALIA